MAEREQTAAILFADVCGSTPLYEDSGDWEAVGVISRVLDAHAAIIGRAGGVVIRSKGDDLLCTFADPNNAALAAVQMLDAQAQHTVQLRIGLHHGSFIEARGDIFGAAVNVGARLMSIAQPNECIVSEQLRRRLCDDLEVTLQHLDEHTIKGRSESMELFRLLPSDDDEVTEFLPKGLDAVSRSATAVELLMGKHTVRCDNSRPNITIGRAKDADLYTPSRRISRVHATVSVRDGRAELTDQSTHGTWLQAMDSEFRLRREAIRLIGTGVIWLGAEPDDREAVQIAFSVLD